MKDEGSGMNGFITYPSSFIADLLQLRGTRPDSQATHCFEDRSRVN
jgi:hypothetical protein